MFTLIASYMTINDLSAQTILRNITLLTYMIPVGIALSGVILVGNMIGAGNIHGAKIYAKMCTVTSLIWAICMVFIINILQNQVIGVFSSQSVINNIIVKAFPVLSIYVFFDCVQGVG